MKYNLQRKTRFQKYVLINVNNSFSIKKKPDKDSMGTIKFYDEKLINKVVNRIIDQRFKKILELIVSTTEDGNCPGSLLLCLNEVEKFKKELINKYEKYLEKKKMERVLKKLEILESEIKNKLTMYAMLQKKPIIDKKNDVYEEKIEHHRSR